MSTAAPGGGIEQAVRPPADIFDAGESIEIRADMPGVTRDQLRITLERNELLVEGDVEAGPGDPVGAARLPRRFRRLFALSDLVDREGMRARLRDGVLELTLPKKALTQRKQISIQ
jgi:HSP20 family protein